MKRKSTQGNKSRKENENRLRSYFVKLFEKYDIRNQNQFINFGRWLIFIVLLLVELLILTHSVERYLVEKDLGVFLSVVGLEVFFAISEWLKLFVLKEGKPRVILNFFSALAGCGFMFVSNSSLVLCIYLLTLTELYIETEKTLSAAVVLIFGVACYEGSAWVRAVFVTGQFNFFSVITQSLGALLAFAIHFIILNISLVFYRQFLKLDRTLKELDKSKRELELAYEAKAELSVLEERQRIAKEIHDTAGHAITTVIMQTESAKRIFEDDPVKAKEKVISANLQAKHALEELRNSVHLLSGSQEGETLKSLLVKIIHESTDGTNITIRSEIADVEVSDSKRRFLCNSLKEGIANGLRHGGATAFWFELKEEEESVEFLLSDNGRGVEMSTLQKGFGLNSMQERARSFGGELYLQSEKDEGFEIRLSLPKEKVCKGG